jgi:LytS/YehU family sensor histidine kinase
VNKDMHPDIRLLQLERMTDPRGHERIFFRSPVLTEGRNPLMRSWPDQLVIAGVPKMFFIRIVAGILSTIFLMMLLGGFIRLAFSYFTSQNEKKVLENANLMAENNLLKSQINPHFLFNTLNSIYSQALHKSANTEKSILKLSEILRYMVYETGSEKILLEKDIYYISSFIDLQRMRLPSSVVIDYEVKGDMNNVYISPLILITFIENAFKYGITFAPAYGIHIHIEVVDKMLTLLVENPIVKHDNKSGGGTGQKNAQRRLDLLYPGKYNLIINTQNEIYSVILKIDLHE